MRTAKDVEREAERLRDQAESLRDEADELIGEADALDEKADKIVREWIKNEWEQNLSIFTALKPFVDVHGTGPEKETLELAIAGEIEAHDEIRVHRLRRMAKQFLQVVL